MTRKTVLVADDDRAVRTVLARALARLGLEVRATGDAASLWDWVAKGEGDLVIVDVVLPDADGLDLIPRLQKLRPDLRVIAMSARNTMTTAIRAAEKGAFEYLPKPFDLARLVECVRRAVAVPAEDSETPEPGGGFEERPPLVGRSAAMQELYRVIGRVLPTDLTVLVVGESGTGKEIVARALHDHGRRRGGPFVPLNMAAIPRELIESELFGHERGAFTGALARHSGRFEQAKGGTLFLDEIGDMPPESQTRLLRVLQDGSYAPVGARAPARADVRIIAATNRDMRHLIRQGRFREDLFYRLNVVPIRLPPLRERLDDVPELARHFLALAREQGLPRKTLDEPAIARLKTHPWPGNVRELENLLRRIAALYSQDTITADVVDAELAAPALAEADRWHDDSLGRAVGRHLKTYFDAHDDGLPPAGLYRRVLREVERPMLALCLEATRGNQLRAARLLGLNRNTLRKKLQELDIEAVRDLE